MTAYTPTTEKTMSMPTTSTPRSATMNLFQEVMSRARMRSPQSSTSEARRSARRVAMEVRHQQARELGNLSRYGVS